MARPTNTPRRPRFRLPWRHPPVETGPITLGARRLYILPTRFGAWYAALIGALFIGSLQYGLQLGYLFTFLLVGLGLVTMLHTQRNLVGLRLSALPVAPCHAGEHAMLRIQVDNPGRLERDGLRLSQAGQASPAIDVPPGDSGELSLALPQPRRGRHALGRLTLSSTWPLGLFRCWTSVQFDSTVWVYPALASSPLALPKTGADWGAHDPAALAAPVQGGADADFAGVRDYRPGDSPRRIAWKASARSDALVTKLFEGHASATLWLTLDAAPEPDLEARLSRLARWAGEAEAAGLNWGLHLPSGTLPPGKGEAHLRQALEQLALEQLALEQLALEGQT